MASASRSSSNSAAGKSSSSTTSSKAQKRKLAEPDIVAEYEEDMLLVIVDLNPVWWGLHKVSQNLTGFLESVLAFCNAHLVMSPVNSVAIIGVTPQACDFLYPAVNTEEKALQATEESGLGFCGSGKYELLETMNERVRVKAQSLVAACSELNLRTSVSIAGAITKALCLYTRLNRQRHVGTERLSARILVIKGAEDNPNQYMSLMNAVFTAQKFQIPIDACLLGDGNEDQSSSEAVGASSLLQQAADLTSGIYVTIPQSTALLQYLLFVFLPRLALRPAFTLPCRSSSLRRSAVDFRAACFCHRKLVDIGYVCSVCLSIFCAFSPICSTCHTQFKLQVATPMKKKL